MKPSSLALLAVTLFAVVGINLYTRGQAQNQAPSPARSRSDEMLERWNDIGNKLVAMAQDFPEGKYDYTLQKDQRTFAQNLLHAAALDYVLVRRISGSNLGPDFGEGDNPSRDVFKTKADVVKFVQEAVADGAQVIQKQGDAGLDNTSKFFGNRLAHNSAIWTAAIEHSGEHYGQLVVYYRANNLVPPDTRRHQAQQSSPADIVYAQPGQLVSVDGFRLNLYCMGSGSPTVVFDSGWGDWAPACSKVQPEIARWARACSYDRAGTGFSDPGPMPRTSVHIAEELRTALHHAGIGGPYILVGSAFGGDNVRTFVDLYMDEVAGLVLVDADSTDVEPNSMREEEHRGLAGIPSDLRVCRNAIAQHKPLPVTSSLGRPPQTCVQQFFFRGLPEAAWSPELNAKVLEIAQTKLAMYDSYSSEMEQTPADEIYLQQHRRSFGSRPIRVLTSGNHAVGHLERKPPDTPKHVKYEQEITLAQARWLGLSSNAKQIFARNSSEYIQFDEPETVINAIREVYDQARKPVAHDH